MTTERAANPIDAARAAVARGDHGAAYDLLTTAETRPRLTLSDLPLLADAAYFSNHANEAVAAWERAHALALQAGDTQAAAGAAIRVALLFFDMGRLVQVRAWIRRIESLVENEPESGLHAGAAVLRAFSAFLDGDLATAHVAADRALEIAERLNDRPMIIFASNAKARTLLTEGSLEEGLELLEESALGAMSGELDAMGTGLMYCSVICACQSIGEYSRADEWTTAMERWTDQSVPHSHHGRCRIHRAQSELRRGEWEAAEANARRGADELRVIAPIEEGWALTEVGTVRLRMGDLDGAQAAFDRADAAGFDPQPGMALLRLARGDARGALAAIREAIADPPDVPSKETPPNTDLRRAPLLAAEVEIATAVGERATARSAVDELGRIARELRLRPVDAIAAHAMGTALLADDPAGARQQYQAAARAWQELGAPYDAARARVGVAAAMRAAGNDERAQQEYRAALQVFERLGARLDVEMVRSALGGRDAVSATGGDVQERGVRAFMFTDIVRSTALVEAMGDEAWRHLQRWHNETIRRLVVANRGVVVSTAGDGFFLTFDSPADALACAIAIQRELDRHRRTAGFAPQVRIGLHQAEATRDGSDWTGSAVHLAARIGAVADGGQIVASRETAQAAGAADRSSAARIVTLKGFTAPTEIVTIDWRPATG